MQFGRYQHSLGKDWEEAFRRYRELLLHEEGKPPRPNRSYTVAEVADRFLDWSERHNDERTYDWYRSFLQSFSDLYGGLEAMEMRPHHVTRWLDSEPEWAEATRRCATAAVKRAFNWADAEGHLPENPPKGRARRNAEPLWNRLSSHFRLRGITRACFICTST